MLPIWPGATDAISSTQTARGDPAHRQRVGVAAGGPGAAAAPVVGFLNGASPTELSARVAAFRDGLAERGYVEGNTVAVEYHWGLGQYDRLPDIAVDLVRRGVAVIAATGGVPSVRAAKA